MTLLVARALAGDPELALDEATLVADTGAGFGGVAAGDINGDGFSDVVGGRQREATVHLFLGTSKGLAATPAATLVGDVLMAPGDS